jgi:hypothetical protein
MPWLRPTALVCATVYCAALGLIAHEMRQPPDDISRFMAHLGPVPFILFPFETMWKSARAGTLNPGDQAPDFTLPRLDHTGSVRLSDLRGKRPVVLVFGSYT